MKIEERLRKAFHAAGPDGPPPAEAWDGIQDRIRRRGRRRHKLGWAVWLAPVVALAVGVPVVESLAPAGRSWWKSDTPKHGRRKRLSTGEDGPLHETRRTCRPVRRPARPSNPASGPAVLAPASH